MPYQGEDPSLAMVTSGVDEGQLSDGSGLRVAEATYILNGTIEQFTGNNPLAVSQDTTFASVAGHYTPSKPRLAVPGTPCIRVWHATPGTQFSEGTTIKFRVYGISPFGQAIISTTPAVDVSNFDQVYIWTSETFAVVQKIAVEGSNITGNTENFFSYAVASWFVWDTVTADTGTPTFVKWVGRTHAGVALPLRTRYQPVTDAWLKQEPFNQVDVLGCQIIDWTENAGAALSAAHIIHLEPATGSLGGFVVGDPRPSDRVAGFEYRSPDKIRIVANTNQRLKTLTGADIGGANFGLEEVSVAGAGDPGLVPHFLSLRVQVRSSRGTTLDGGFITGDARIN